MLAAKLAIKAKDQKGTVVSLGSDITCGGKDILLIAGPCTVESMEQMETTASMLTGSVQALRGGAYKPRTSPYAFQGLGQAALEILSSIKDKHRLPVVTEVMSAEQIPSVVEHADMLQVGSRNMQNYELLKALGQAGKPVLLKRGLSATLEEFLLAAEYILSYGNREVILCERGIRSFDTHTRNVLDLAAVVSLKQMTHLPVIVDPSHAAGKSELIADLARAAIACGADGLIIECHPEPGKSVSDARQAISLQDMVSLVESLKPIAQAVGRQIPSRHDISTHAITNTSCNMVSADSTVETIEDLRESIDRIDDQMSTLLSRRFQLARQLAAIKAKLNLPVLNLVREQEVLDRVSLKAQDEDMSRRIKRVWKSIIAESRSLQDPKLKPTKMVSNFATTSILNGLPLSRKAL